MLKSISWHQFITTLLIISLTYYAVILSVYHRFLFDSLKTVKGKFFRAKRIIQPISKNGDENLFDVSSSLANNLKANITEAGVQNLLREELLFSIQSILKEYQVIIGTPFQPAINNLIETNCNKECSIHLSADELRGLWMG